MKARHLTSAALLSLAVPAVACSSAENAPSLHTGQTSQGLTTRTFQWSAAGGDLPLIPASQGFCYFTALAGQFQWQSQLAQLQVQNGVWTAVGHTFGSGIADQPFATIQCNDWSDFTFQNTGTITPQFVARQRLVCAEAWWEPGCTPEFLYPPAQSDIDLPDARSFCFMSGMSGMFNGVGESVDVTQGIDATHPGKLLVVNHDLDSDQETLGTAHCIALGGATGVFRTLTTRTLSQGSDPVDLGVSADSGVCAITGITGKFYGHGEQVFLSKSPRNTWVMNVSSGQAGVGFTVTCAATKQVQAPPPPPPPPPPPAPTCRNDGAFCTNDTTSPYAAHEKIAIDCDTIAAPLDFYRLDAAGTPTYLTRLPAGTSAPTFYDEPGQGTFTYQVCNGTSCTPNFTIAVPAPSCTYTPPPTTHHCPTGQVWCDAVSACTKPQLCE